MQRIPDASTDHLSDNASAEERLRLRLIELESQNQRLQDEVLSLEDQIATLRRQNVREQEAYDFLERQLVDVEGENLRMQEQSVEFGVQNTYLAGLYAASSCLQESVERQEVLEVIQDIVVNLIGSQELAIFELAPDSNFLELAYASGLEPGSFEHIPLGDGLLGTVALTGEPYLAGLCDASLQREDEAFLSAGIPLKVGDRVTGVVAVFRLLPQKVGSFGKLDRKIFDLLARQGGTSLFRTAVAELGLGQYLH